MVSALDVSSYHQTKTPINFWCKRELKPRSLIQSSETLLVELIGTHLQNLEILLKQRKTLIFFSFIAPFLTMYL